MTPRRSGWEAREEALAALRPLLGRKSFMAIQEALLLVRKRLEDTEPLVKIVALELCEEFKIRLLAPDVLRLLSDRDALTRGYAAVALGAFTGYSSELKGALGREKDDTAKVRMVGALLSERKAPKKDLFMFVNSKDYRVRISAIKFSSRLNVTSRWFEERLEVLAREDGLAVAEVATRRLAELRRGSPRRL